MKTQQEWVKELGLEPHPEGGYYVRKLASPHITTVNGNERPLYTSIYFLLTSKNPSHFHQLKSDEVWYYHAGHALTVHELLEDGSYTTTEIGPDTAKGELLQYVVKAGSIFGSSVNSDDSYSLVSCMVSPGFDYRDFTLFTQAELLASHSNNPEIIKELAFETLPE